MSKRLILVVAVGVMFLSSAGIVTFLSAQEGGAAAPTAAGHPGKPAGLDSRYASDRLLRTTGGAIWRASRDEGVQVSRDGGETWGARNAGLPVRAVWPFDADRPPVVTGIAVDALDEQRVGVATLDALYLSSDAGGTWTRLELKDPIRANDQLTCIALAPGNPAGLAVGTSFHGFFETADGGKTWTSLSEKLVPLKLGGGNYEEVAALAYDPSTPGLFWFGLGFGKGLYSYARGSSTAESIPLPAGADPGVRGMSFLRPAAADAWRLEVRTDGGRWRYSPITGAWNLEEAVLPHVALAPDKAARLAAAGGRYGIYVSSFWTTGKYWQTHLAFLKAQGLNSIIVDFKDDNGYLTYDTALAEPRRIGAVQKRFAIDEIVKAAHDNGLYLVGRIVTFRDKQLYNADSYRYAAWNAAIKGPWRYLKKTVDETTGEEGTYQGEYWVDPYAEPVWDYNIAIAKELQDHGVDEVQFDYIRFPSDGDVGGITWRFRRPGMGKMEALESFLAKARSQLSFPISADVYGYAGWARISNWVAQNIEMYSRYVDVIQPMFYPSHFPRDFLGSMEYLPRAQYIYEEGTKRSAYIVEGRAVIRPYVQSFRIGNELSFPPAVYSTYLLNQVRGSLQGAASGFTLWNASNDYYMVTVPLGPIIEGGLAARGGGR